MTAGKIALGCLVLAVLLLLADDLAARIPDWYRRRRREREMRKYNLAAFRGARKFDDPRWPS